MHSFLAFLSLTLTLCSAQFFYHQPAALQHYQTAHREARSDYAHPSVVANAVYESELPPELLKSEVFYKNPHIAAALAKESWFTEQEMPVLDREAEKIPREQVYKIFKNAGWIKRR